MASLQEQLLKAGLTTKQKARQANTEKRKKNKQKRSGVKVEASLQEQVKQDLVNAKQAKQDKDMQLNAEKKEALAKKEHVLRIQQILEHHQVTGINGDKEYNYNFDGKVKKLAVDEKSYDAIVSGRLAICGIDEKSYVVTAQTANKLAELDEKVVLVLNENTAEEIDEDDPYAEFQIPDDLMW